MVLNPDNVCIYMHRVCFLCLRIIFTMLGNAQQATQSAAMIVAGWTGC